MSGQGEAGERRALVLGLGNTLLQDEGLGVRALERLHARFHLPAAVQGIEGGVLGLDLLPYLEPDVPLVVIDAVQSGARPGQVVRLEGDAIPRALALKTSLHQVGLLELLAAALLRGTLPRLVVLWGMEPGCLDWGTALTPAVAQALDTLVDSVADELRGWGHDVQERLAESRAGCAAAWSRAPWQPPHERA